MSEDGVHRLVVKVGTSTLTGDRCRIDRGYIADLAAQLAVQRAAGLDVALVTSGAIRAGRERLEEDGGRWPVDATLSNALPLKQAAAAIGQGRLIQIYNDAFAWRGVTAAQVLLTRDDLSDRRRFLNARNTLTALFSLGVVPILNENDTVAVDEIRFGDNDTLAARVAVLVGADLLLILSDVEGLYAVPPSAGEVEGSELVPEVRRIDETIDALAGGAGSAAGTGGMRTKIEAARIATASGIRTVIARGRREHVVADVVAGRPVGTAFLPGADRLRGRKRWIVAGSRPKGTVTVNACAADRLRRDAVSLLAVGIVQVTGEFDSGDLIEVRDEAGCRVARGLTNFSAQEVRAICGEHSDRFETILGYKPSDEVIHRDNLVVDH